MSTYRITVRAVGDGPPPEIRIRRLLKIALRAFGLRCVGVEQNGTAKPLAGDATTARPSETSTPQTGGNRERQGT